MSKLITPFLIFVACTAAIFWAWNYSPTVRETVESYLETGDFLTLEARFDAEQLTTRHGAMLPAGEDYTIYPPRLLFHPYLLAEVKFSKGDHSTAEEIMLWSLMRGEMVLDTQTWQLSHGFEDCIRAGATRNEYVVLRGLMKRKSGLDLAALAKVLHSDPDQLQPVLNSMKEKQLIVEENGRYRAHFSQLALPPEPATDLRLWLVSKTYKHSFRERPRFARREVLAAARAAFGDDLAIKQVKDIYVPVYAVEVKNPDGTVLTHYWNAVSGQKLETLH